MLSELAMFGRYALGLRSFFSSTTSLPEARQILSSALASRPQSLIRLMRGGIWDNPRSPYLALLRHAGIERPELESLITREGVEAALLHLHKAGVYVTLDEFKGNSPIRRPGLNLPVRHQDFDNPLLTVHFEGRTGGSRGPRRRLLVDLNLIAADAAAHRVFLDAFDLVGRPSAVWRPVPPNNSGLKKPLMDARLGLPLQRWFSQTPTRWSPSEFKYAAFTATTVLAARLAGRLFPYPEHVPLPQAETVARWMAVAAARGRPAFLDSAVSAAVRVCSAARALGLDISGSMFRTGGEPLTAAKAQIIAASGSRVACHYSMSETGPVGMACADPASTDDVHILSGKMAVVQHPSSTALLVTTLSSLCPKILINVDNGDSGVLEHRACSCSFGQLGFHLHLHHIRSHEKLTSEGLQFSPSDLLHVIEVVLPRTFGGVPTDYQFLEEDINGLPRVSILVSPRLGPLDEAEILHTVLDAFSRLGPGGRLMAGQLEQARALRVQRREPLLTPAAKVLPLFVAPRP